VSTAMTIKFTVASLALLGLLLVAGLAAWVVNNPSTAAVHPRPEYAGLRS
jgi:hypothetical protein